jgi:hypothetical protein
MSLNPPFDQLFSDPQIQTLRSQTVKPGRVHPLVAVALHPGLPQSPNKIAINTCMALNHVLTWFPAWANNLKSRLLEPKDWASAESALAEIRACGALLEAGYPVVLGGKNADTGAKPEFHILLDSVETIVEVWNRNLAGNAAATGTPFGAPDPEKPGDSVLTNAIQRVAAVKEREHQAASAQPFVIWADLQSVETMRFDYSDHLQPLMSWNGVLESGAYWHALYGRKGDMLFESGMSHSRINTLLHDGRFNQQMKHGGRTRISGFIFSSPKTTAFLENPDAPFPIPIGFRKQLIQLPQFEIGVSLANWSEGLAARSVRVQRQYIAGVIRHELQQDVKAGTWYGRLILRCSDWLAAKAAQFGS